MMAKARRKRERARRTSIMGGAPRLGIGFNLDHRTRTVWMIERGWKRAKAFRFRRFREQLFLINPIKPCPCRVMADQTG
jgi:hypothetical protein